MKTRRCTESKRKTKGAGRGSRARGGGRCATAGQRGSFHVFGWAGCWAWPEKKRALHNTSSRGRKKVQPTRGGQGDVFVIRVEAHLRRRRVVKGQEVTREFKKRDRAGNSGPKNDGDTQI